jgi:hypothetical protein
MSNLSTLFLFLRRRKNGFYRERYLTVITAKSHPVFLFLCLASTRTTCSWHQLPKLCKYQHLLDCSAWRWRHYGHSKRRELFIQGHSVYLDLYQRNSFETGVQLEHWHIGFRRVRGTALAFLYVNIIFQIGFNPKSLLQASAAMQMRSALFWDITQRRVVILYRRFGTTYRSHFQGSRSLISFLLGILAPWTDTLSRNVGKWLPFDAA